MQSIGRKVEIRTCAACSIERCCRVPRRLPQSSDHRPVCLCRANENPTTSRRTLLASTTILTLGSATLSFSGQAAEDLVPFTDSKGEYTLNRPKDWEQTSKAGADVLFKAPSLRSTDLGVTINPIRIQRLDQLGDIKTVGDRLLAAEKKKESTKSIEMLNEDMQTARSGTKFFVFDYTISTTRGDKRIFSKVGVAKSQLFIVNGSIKCEGKSCKSDTDLVSLVRQSVQSFDLST